MGAKAAPVKSETLGKYEVVAPGSIDSRRNVFQHHYIAISTRQTFHEKTV
jgi:hypothetical protein